MVDGTIGASGIQISPKWRPQGSESRPPPPGSSRGVWVRCGVGKIREGWSRCAAEVVCGLWRELWAGRGVRVMRWRGARKLICRARGHGVVPFIVRTIVLLIAMVVLAVMLVVLAAACGGNLWCRSHAARLWMGKPRSRLALYTGMCNRRATIIRPLL